MYPVRGAKGTGSLPPRGGNFSATFANPHHNGGPLSAPKGKVPRYCNLGCCGINHGHTLPFLAWQIFQVGGFTPLCCRVPQAPQQHPHCNTSTTLSIAVRGLSVQGYCNPVARRIT